MFRLSVFSYLPKSLACLILVLTGFGLPVLADNSSNLPNELNAGELLYQNSMENANRVSDWVMEGPGQVSFKDGWMHMQSPNEEMHHVFWCPKRFPENFIAQWDVQNMETDAGLCIVFFAAAGLNNQSIFSDDLPKRDGNFQQYTQGKIRCYHTSYYANAAHNPNRQQTNLRKNPGFHLVQEGEEGIPTKSEDIHTITLAKEGSHIRLWVDDRKVIDWTDEGKVGGQPHGDGYIGLRQMKWTHFRYRNFRVWAIADGDNSIKEVSPNEDVKNQDSTTTDSPSTSLEAIPGAQGLAVALPDKEAHLNEPYVEWTLSYEGNDGNPYDVIAHALFTHEKSSVTKRSLMFYDGEGTDLIGLNASNLRLYGAEGEIHKTIPLDISPAGLSYDRDTHTLLLGSGISGGDCIYIIRMNQSGWEEALEKLGYQGKLATIVSNIEQLIAQIKDFQPPPYQPLEHPDVLSVFPYGPYNPGTLSELETGRSFAPLMALHEQEFPYTHLNFAGNQWFSEDWDRSHLLYGWGEQRDRRMTYKFTSKEIVDHAKRLEAEGLSFVMTAGHGNDPFFMSPETFEGILRAAPTTCKGFIFPEVSRNDTPGYHYAVKKHFQAICELCLEHGKRKVFFRSKFLFWAGDCYTDMWSWMLEDKRYRDVLVPAMEETYERLGDLSLSGRVGLHQTGFVSDWAGRAVLDNPCYDREHHWSAPMVGSHFLRALCYRASLGARYFLIQVGGSTLRSGEAAFRDHGLLVVKPFLHMLGKGILPLPNDREDLLSLSPVALGMRKPSQEFMRASHNSHRITKYESDPPWVFSRLQCFWGQAPTPAYDFGYYAIGRHSQALNFLPIHPYGFVSILPDDIELSQYPQYTKKISTDGECFYNSRGLRQSAEEYRPVVERSLQDAAESLPIMVEGDVAWSAVRIDPQHIRLVLIDKGYLDPAERSAIVRFQNIRVSECRDILSRERIDIADETMKLTVPAGVLRIVDVTHR